MFNVAGRSSLFQAKMCLPGTMAARDSRASSRKVKEQLPYVSPSVSHVAKYTIASGSGALDNGQMFNLLLLVSSLRTSSVAVPL